MCGICGIVANNSLKTAEHAVIQHMCDCLQHRGPDDAGFYSDSYAQLAMRRLSIIDLATGHQPISNEDKSLWLVFNGEIYNYRELRRKLERQGHVFQSQSDSEVIIHAYEEYGDQCMLEFNGMFAFAIWDNRKQALLVARDRLGIKPLYYWTNHGKLVFGSELKAIIAHPDTPAEIDPVALDHFLTLEYVPAPRTIFAGIQKLPPGHWLLFRDGQLTISQYWELSPDSRSVDVGTCEEELTELIRDAVRLRLVSDVPIGAFLSGGIDSSTVVSFMSEAMTAPVRTFSIGFDDATYDELPQARAVAQHFGTLHEERKLNPDIRSMAERLVSHMDEPFADFSIFPTYLVSKLASEQVKVVLTGDGGDEVFGGYDTYVAQDLSRYYHKLPRQLGQNLLPSLLSRIPPQPAKKGIVNKAKRFVEGARLPHSLQHTRWMLFMSQAEKRALYHPTLHKAVSGDMSADLLANYFGQVAHANQLAQQQFVDIKTYLVDDILTKVDRMSMAVSLEARVPLLDHRIVEFALNLPPHYKLYRGQTKRILRKIMADRLPGAVLRKPKQGFSIPLKHWLRGPLQPMMIDLLSANSVRSRGHFNPEIIDGWITEHLKNQANHSHRLWALMVFEIWHRQILDIKRESISRHSS